MDKYQRNKLQFTQNIQSTITILPNDFIDRYMLKADGEYVKIYLLLLRLMNRGDYQGPEQLADMLELTQRDVLRALQYWEKEGLLQSEDTEVQNTQNSSTSAAKSASTPQPAVSVSIRQIPAKVSIAPKELSSSIQGTDLEQTVYMAETYLGHPLSHGDLLTLHYIENQLHFTPELLEYLIEYCVTKGKKSIRYMETVAISWYEQNIDTVKKAKEQSAAYSENVFPIMKAFGISNRTPVPAELNFIKKWNAMGFDTNLLVEACNRTMLATHQVSFPYATSILESWKKENVRNMQDVLALDRKYHSQKSASQAANNNNNSTAAPSNSFHNFEQRSYDYDDLEARLLDIKSDSI